MCKKRMKTERLCAPPRPRTALSDIVAVPCASQLLPSTFGALLRSSRDCGVVCSIAGWDREDGKRPSFTLYANCPKNTPLNCKYCNSRMQHSTRVYISEKVGDTATCKSVLCRQLGSNSRSQARKRPLSTFGLVRLFRVH